MTKLYIRITDRLWPETGDFATATMVLLGLYFIGSLIVRSFKGYAQLYEFGVLPILFGFSLAYVRFGRPLVERWFIEGPITRVMSYLIPFELAVIVLGFYVQLFGPAF